MALPGALPPGIFGTRYFVSAYLCRPEFVRYRRVSRRKRVAKKFRKKYGAVVACTGVCVWVEPDYHACPCVAAEIEKLRRHSGFTR